MKFSKKKATIKKKEVKNVKQKVVPKVKEEVTIKPVKFQSFRRSFLDWRYIKQWWIKRNAPSSQMFIEMQLRTGKWDYFFVSVGSKSSFNYNGGEYIIDSDLMEYVSTLNMYSLRYHQEYCCPVSQKIPAKDIKDAIVASGTLDIENSTNPTTLRNFVVSDVIKDVIQSSGIHTYLKAMQLMVVITMISVLIFFVIYLIKSGIFKELSGAVGL